MTAHSIHGMSGQSIALACPGSINMQKGMEDPSEENLQREKGSAVHDAGEFCFHTGAKGDDLVGLRFSGVKMTKEMANSTDIYANQLREFDKPCTVTSHVELRTIISSIDKERLWGTGDYIGVDLINRKLIVADYKNGYVSVEIDGFQFIFALNTTLRGNAQVIGYALGALDKFALWDKVDTIETYVIQPNKPHKDGAVRKFTHTIADMLMWWNAYKAGHEMTLLPFAPRYAGKHCKYCKARGVCSTRIAKTMNDISLDTSISHVNSEQLIALFEESGAMINSLKQIQQEVFMLARNGHKIPDHKLVRQYQRAEVKDEEELVADAIAQGKTKEEIYNFKIKSKTDMKKMLGNEFAEKHYKKPEAGLKLVSNNDPGIAQRADKINSAVGVFSPIEQGN